MDHLTKLKFISGSLMLTFGAYAGPGVETNTERAVCGLVFIAGVSRVIGAARSLKKV